MPGARGHTDARPPPGGAPRDHARATAPRDNLKGGLWLLADLGLNLSALALVKAMGLHYAAAQLVFLRAGVGAILIAPWIWQQRAMFRDVSDWPLHLLRVALSAITLLSSFYALARVPLALFTAMAFTRPIVIMVLAALLLGERIGRRRWGAAAVALCGVVIAVEPQTTPLTTGLGALFVTVLAGSAAVIATRGLRAAPPIVLMTVYTLGLTLVSFPLALLSWRAIALPDLLPLLLIGAVAQAAQACFLQAHFHGEAGPLALLGYLSLPLSAAIGALFFGEIPGAAFFAGAALVIAASLFGARARPAR
ncbi:MAG: DMT family transporter [Pseudomonadota bacterium]